MIWNKDFGFLLNILKSSGVMSWRVRNMTVAEIHGTHSHFPWVKLLKVLFSSRLISNEVSVFVDFQQC